MTVIAFGSPNSLAVNSRRLSAMPAAKRSRYSPAGIGIGVHAR
jgi:hypothetical protein